MVTTVTVCELPEERESFESAWDRLTAHVRRADSDLVVLPEMPFYSWVPATAEVTPETWLAAVDAHDGWMDRLDELGSAAVLSSRPVVRDGARRNEGFLWTAEDGYRPVHQKAYLPDEDGVWESSWYDSGDGSFEPVVCDGTSIGFLICTELWAGDEVRAYGRSGVDLLVTPRATEAATVDKWLAGGRSAAVSAGAFSISANRVTLGGGPTDFGGNSWVVSPDGAVLTKTDRDRPISTVEIDVEAARRAKDTYPRYALD